MKSTTNFYKLEAKYQHARDNERKRQRKGKQ